MIKGIGKLSASLLGIDKAIAFTLLARIIQAGGSLLAIFLIAGKLSKEEQGYYYTFSSILALQVFFELGFSGIITQFAAHETAHLKYNGTEEDYDGEVMYKSRLSSLLHISIKWFSVMSGLLVIILLLTGYFFFNKYGLSDNQLVNWQGPWVLLSVGTALSIIITPILSFIEGLGKVQYIAQVRLIQQIVQLGLLLLLLTLNFRLYASSIALLISVLVVPLLIIITKKQSLLLRIWNYKVPEYVVSFKKEIFPYQWRIAISWISGYFIFQLFNPVLFATEGAISAGKMGMTLAVLNGILSLSLSWYNTKIPFFSGLIAKKTFTELDIVFTKTAKQASIICTAFLLIFVMGVGMLRYLHLPLGERFIASIPLILMAFCTLVSQFVYGIATYLRCHKKEPLLLQSILMGLFSIISTFVLGNLFGVLGITVGYTFLIITISLLGSLYIFIKKKKEWHL